jgi:FKBP-type peptidyl-prolyl cis-trans isomerase FkpA
MYNHNTTSCFCIFTALLAAIATTTHGFATPRSQSQTKGARSSSSTFLEAMIVARNGLAYEDVEIGTGRNVFAGDSVLCYYVGTYEQGAAGDAGGDNPFFAAFSKGAKTITFDETEPGDPAEVVVGRGQVIKGWDIGICGDQSLEIPPMKIGGDRKLIIPAELAYGERGAGDVIPPNTMLQFQVAIVNAERTDPGVSGSTKLKGFAALVGFLSFMLLSLFVVSQNADKLMSLITSDFIL